MFIPSFLTTIISVNRPLVNMKTVPQKKYPDPDAETEEGEYSALPQDGYKLRFLRLLLQVGVVDKKYYFFGVSFI